MAVLSTTVGLAAKTLAATAATSAATYGGLAIQAAGTVQAGQEARKQTAIAQRRARIEAQQQQIATQRSRRQSIREAQVRRAQTIATAEAAGGLTGSSLAGGLTSLSSQTGEALGFGSQMTDLSRQITQTSTDFAASQARSVRANNLTKVGGGLFSFGAQRGGLNNLFGGSKYNMSAEDVTPRTQAPIPNFLGA